eukprot:3505578-Rhodomonas_salina.2
MPNAWNFWNNARGLAAYNVCSKTLYLSRTALLLVLQHPTQAHPQVPPLFATSSWFQPSNSFFPARQFPSALVVPREYYY